MSIKVEIRGALSLKNQMQILKMSRNQRRKLLDKVAKEVRKQSISRVKRQVDLTGRPYQEHHNKRRRKMLTRLVKAKNFKITITDYEAVLGFKNSYHAQIAAKQQHGYKEVMKASDMKPIRQNRYDEPATREQARGLLEEGFKIKKKSGKGKKRPSMKYIVKTLTFGQAGLILNNMRIESGSKIKKKWVVELPERSFLGATHADVMSHINTIFDTKKQELKRASR